MKIIHCADIHLGSKMELKLPIDKLNERKAEVRSTFKSIVDLAKRENVKIIMLSGDVFDGARAYKKDKEFFYSIVENNPDIDFLYLRGNHDSEEGYNKTYSNLKLFSDEWVYYNYDNVVITGIEMTSKNAVSLYSTLNLNENAVNICMLHGQVSGSTGLDEINLAKLRDKNIDYLALGHVHSYQAGQLDARAIYAYSGCPEGRGYDEFGEKGVILLNVEDKAVSHKFIKLSKRVIHDVRVDISGAKTDYEVCLKIKEVAKLNQSDLYRIELFGSAEYDTDGVEEEARIYLQGDCYAIYVKDKSKKKIDVTEIEGDVSLKGEFIRQVLQSDLTEEEKEDVIALGLTALQGEKI